MDSWTTWTGYKAVLKNTYFLKMGNKEGKYKKVFEEIDYFRAVWGNDISPCLLRDGRVSLEKLENFLDIDQNPGLMEGFLLSYNLDNAEIKVIAEGVAKIRENDKDGDGKLTLDEFVQAMKANEKMNKLFLKIVED